MLPPAILQVHFLETYPKPVFKLQPFPSQYWHSVLHVKLIPPHWTFWHLSDLVHFLPSLQDIPFLFVHAELVELGLHHWKKNKQIEIMQQNFTVNFTKKNILPNFSQGRQIQYRYFFIKTLTYNTIGFGLHVWQKFTRVFLSKGFV